MNILFNNVLLTYSLENKYNTESHTFCPFHSSQCSRTGVPKGVVCAILFVGWRI